MPGVVLNLAPFLYPTGAEKDDYPFSYKRYSWAS